MLLQANGDEVSLQELGGRIQAAASIDPEMILRFKGDQKPIGDLSRIILIDRDELTGVHSNERGSMSFYAEAKNSCKNLLLLLFTDSRSLSGLFSRRFLSFLMASLTPWLYRPKLLYPTEMKIMNGTRGSKTTEEASITWLSSAPPGLAER